MADLVFSRPQTHNPELVFGERDDVPVEPVDSPGALVFSAPQTHSAALVFGERGDTPEPGGNATVDFVAELPGMFASIGVRIGIRVGFVAALPEMFADVRVAYASNTPRPTVGQTRATWQSAQAIQTGTAAHWQDGQHANTPTATRWQNGQRLAASLATRWRDTDRSARPATRTLYQNSVPTRSSTGVRYQDGIRTLRPQTSTRYQNAQRAQAATTQRFQDALRDRRTWTRTRWQDALPLARLLSDSARNGTPLFHTVRTRYQDAMRPPAGMWVPPGPALPDPCYVPPHGLHVELLFADAWSASTELVFICERHGGGPGPDPEALIVIPVRRYYVVINDITLRRVAGNITLPATSFTMSIDVDSWTWSWSATMPSDARQYLVPVDGAPVEVEASVNGVPYRLAVEGISRDRTFAKSRISVRGRGLAAVLDAPYAPTLNFGNTAARTAQQLMADVLTVNSVGIGWAVDWGLTDWLVPGNIWTHQGSYISAINQIASAAGGYVQPHATLQTLRILPRYPAGPWSWATVSPDFELPSAVVTVEGIEWTAKPAYNRVHVSGVAGGIQAQATRAGTAGNLSAPMVTDPLITHADAARQRALQVLADVGAQARVTLKMPVLAETGIITPGKFIRYTDGPDSRIGIVRGTSLDWSAPTLRQTLDLETHGTD